MEGTEGTLGVAQVTLHMDGTFSARMTDIQNPFARVIEGNLTCSNGKMIGVGYSVVLGSDPLDYMRVVMEICPKTLSVHFRLTQFLALVTEDPLDSQPCLRDPQLEDPLLYIDFTSTLKKICNINSIAAVDLAREPIEQTPP